MIKEEHGIASMSSKRKEQAKVEESEEEGRRKKVLLGSEARKALQIFVQNNDCSERC